ncbi:MAG: hypothetical protein BWZ10_01347 [candidate division BRC1 bacterium ADurb.BinA364]|nr:MAG: hypothetical protein BWZ10_01347 [candidate division BRC1 bacterium ADurb.BinA364]
MIVHSWQRHGYDNRLPDIWPPNPLLGDPADLAALSRLCAENDILFGVHDNYIDFYPDAEGYTYDNICMSPQGQPVKAWINQTHNAQSYRWRPDRFQPFLERNLALIKEGLAPSASFVDVFAAASPMDFYDREGNFHPASETRQRWGEAFATIRETFGGAPTVSEAGSDALIGWLDGADCQFLQLGEKPQRYQNVVSCEDWARVPWFDAVHHSRFSLHGVGYSVRYQGGRSRDRNGINSDDYISAELLTGHALMTDWLSMTREAVRKHWLAQDFIRARGLDDIEAVEYAGGDPRRLIVRWHSGATVHINRSDSDWIVEGRVLPEFGYLARDGEIESSIERIGGVIAERSSAPGRFYVNGRGFDPAPELGIEPRARAVEYLGGRDFKLIVDWRAEDSTPEELRVFTHIYQPQVSRLYTTGWDSGGTPETPTTQWQGVMTTGADWVLTVPEECPAGEYEIFTGLYNPRNRARARLTGDEAADRRYRIGTLIVEAAAGAIRNIRLDVSNVQPPPASRLNPAKTPIDFGECRTHGALRGEVKDGALILTPLPDGEPFLALLRLDRILGRPAKAAAIHCLDRTGKALGPVEFEKRADGILGLAFDGLTFAYRIETTP